jgi:hypothetical protein
MVDLPETPAEAKLSELRRLRREAEKYEKYQEIARFKVFADSWCGHCPYPDVCPPKRPYAENGCVLDLLTRRYEADWWTRLLTGQRAVPGDETKTFERIRQSVYYKPQHEEYLQRVNRTGRR